MSTATIAKKSVSAKKSAPAKPVSAKTNVAKEPKVGPRNHQRYSLTSHTVQVGTIFERDTLPKACYAAVAIAKRFGLAATVKPIDGTYDITVTAGGARPGPGVLFSAGYATNVG